MLATVNEETVALLCKWREECRLNLLDLEKKSICVRVCAVQKIINEKTYQINRMLCIEGINITQYAHDIDANQQCKFIQNWNGLNTNQMRSLPKSFQEYESRAKNWLNGRRAINYAQTLFPELILSVEHYAQSISAKLYPRNREKQHLYFHILLYSYLSGICCGRVALYDNHHRASLICENSIKKEGNLKRILQKYFNADRDTATNHGNFSFPKHLQHAIDYFKDKYHEKLNQFQVQYTHSKASDSPNIVHQSQHSKHISCDSYQAHRGQTHSVVDFRSNPYGFGGHNAYPSTSPLSSTSFEYDSASSSSSSHHLINKMNVMQRRNVFLEQQLMHYKEQQRLDHQRIKLLENQLSIYSRPSFHSFDDNQPPFDHSNNNNNGDAWISSSCTSWNMDASSPVPIPIPFPFQPSIDIPLPTMTHIGSSFDTTITNHNSQPNFT